MKCSRIRNLAIFLFVPAIFPAAALAQTSQPADSTIHNPAPEGSDSTDSLPRLAADYTRAVAVLDDARQQRSVALADLERIRSRVRRELLESPDVEDARVALTNAQDQYTRERDQVVDQLQANPAYATDRKKAAAIDAQLTSLRERADVVDARVTSMATQRLHYSAEADSIEQGALKSNVAYEQAKERYVSAARQHETALGQVEQRVEADPDVQRARETWQDARDDWQDARTRLAGAHAAYVTALDEHRQKMHYLQTHGPAEPWYPFGGYGLNIP
jgi:chromosome segregation ATPase